MSFTSFRFAGMHHAACWVPAVVLLALALPGIIPAAEERAKQPVKAVIVEDTGLLGGPDARAVVLVEVTESLDRALSDAFTKGARFLLTVTGRTRLEKQTETGKHPAQLADLKKGARVEIRDVGLVHLSQPGQIAPGAVLIVPAGVGKGRVAPDLDEGVPIFTRPEKPSPERLAGMKAALADIEKGILKQKLPSLTEPAWVKTYAAMLSRLQPVVECEGVGPEVYQKSRDRIDGYNSVMRAEIESRFAGDRLFLDQVKEWAMRGGLPSPGQKIFRPEELLQPLKGELRFERLEKGKWVAYQGESIGREWDQRKYLPGAAPKGPFSAVWTFKKLPPRLAGLERISVDLNLDLFRTTRGEENRDVELQVTFINRTRWQPGQEAQYLEARARKGDRRPSDGELAKQFGRFDIPKLKVSSGAEPAARMTIPSALLEDLKDGVLEVRLQFASPVNRNIWIGVGVDDLLIYTR